MGESIAADVHVRHTRGHDAEMAACDELKRTRSHSWAWELLVLVMVSGWLYVLSSVRERIIISALAVVVILCRRMSLKAWKPPDKNCCVYRCPECGEPWPMVPGPGGITSAGLISAPRT